VGCRSQPYKRAEKKGGRGRSKNILVLVGKTVSSSSIIWIEDMTVSIYCGAVIGINFPDVCCHK
jgi:hypothetical protein